MARRAPRLPGFRFETQAPPLPEVLPRMDIAVFVGFAASGPLQLPVAVESEAQFTAIFGADAPLAWDFERGEQLYAYLGPAVRAFFRNNGRRCWIIRVAKRTGATNRARYNCFSIPGLAHIEFDEEGKNKVTPAFARARSEGSWSDRLQVSSALLSTPVQSQGTLLRAGGEYSIRVARAALNSLHAGDLLRMDFANGQFAFLGVSEVELRTSSPPTSPLSNGPALEVRGTNAVWFAAVKGSDLPAAPGFANIWLFGIEGVASPHSEPIDTWLGIPKTGSISAADGDWDGTIQVELSGCAFAHAPLPGALVRIDISSQQWWMTVETLTTSADAVPVILGKAFRAIDAPDPLPAQRPKCSLLTLEIWVRKDDEYSISLGELGFTQGHDRFWARLPTDEQVYDDLDPFDAESPSTILWRQVGDLFRFPLAGPAENSAKPEIYVPLSIGILPENYLGAIKLPGTALERDGLAKFNEKLFLDRNLTATSLSELAGQAEYLTYLAPQPRKLNGIHAVFALEEATLMCVPDAAHRGWTSVEREPLPSPVPSSPPIRPEWWHFLDCDSDPTPIDNILSDCNPPGSPPPKIQGVHEPSWGNFISCSIEVIPAPALFLSTEISSDGTFVVLWDPASPAADRFILEESATDDFFEAETIYSGTATTFAIYGRKPGDYLYRVRAFAGQQSSDWSNTEVVRVGEVSRWAVKPVQDYSPDMLLAVQRSVLRLCGARGDLVCLLSLPEHYREDATIEHARLLRAMPNLAPATNGVAPLGLGEAKALTYGALFHPWLIEREEEQSDRLVLMPPCGAVCGLFAERAINRGAWIAPANQEFRGVVALEPLLNPQRRLDLQEAHINLLRQEPRGFVVLDADTLSDDVDLRQMNVRRLLILLRRQALKLGATYVFEPNSPAFRRMVDRGFSDMLDGMFERGAFAGNNPATSYLVVTDDSLNTAESVDQGRFIVELRVAPSVPMSFLTIRLVQTSERSLATEVR
jgi:hypothetical protein